MNSLKKIILAYITIAFVAFGFCSQASELKIGVVLLHGNGKPNALIEPLRHELASHNILVIHPEMPFSISRRYDKDVLSAVKQVDNAFSKLKAEGATKLFLAGHSKGGVFAVYYATMHKLDGLIAIAPGGNVSARVFRKKLGDAVAKAKQMIDAGNGDDVSNFKDFEGSRGVTGVHTNAEAYYSWFNPGGAMNLRRSVRRLSPDLPVLWIVAKNDYPGLRKANLPLYKELPRNPNTRLYQPDSTHKAAPRVSADKIISWIEQVAQQ